MTSRRGIKPFQPHDFKSQFFCHLCSVSTANGSKGQTGPATYLSQRLGIKGATCPGHFKTRCQFVEFAFGRVRGRKQPLKHTFSSQLASPAHQRTGTACHRGCCHGAAAHQDTHLLKRVFNITKLCVNSAFQQLAVCRESQRISGVRLEAKDGPIVSYGSLDPQALQKPATFADWMKKTMGMEWGN